MAQRVVTQLVDDITGEEIAEGKGETVSFALDGRAYTIDLTSKNADKFRGLFQDRIAVAMKAGRAPSQTAKRPSGGNTKEVREAARSNGWPDLGDRGRVPAEVQESFR